MSAEDLKTEYPETLILQLMGKFFIAYDDDALIVSQLTSYKLQQRASGRLRCGFPADSDKALEKFKNACEKERVSYAIFKNGEIFSAKEYDNNRFKEFLTVTKPLEQKKQIENTETVAETDRQMLRYLQADGNTLEESMMRLYLKIKNMTEKEPTLGKLSSIATESCQISSGFEVCAILIFGGDVHG